MLLERGADPGREDFNKCDAVTLAQKYRSHDCLVMIEQSMRERARSLSVLAANVRKRTFSTLILPPSLSLLICLSLTRISHPSLSLSSGYSGCSWFIPF